MARTPAYDAALRALDAQWDRLVAALPALDPAAPSRVAGWTVADVEAHLTLTTESLTGHLATPDPGGPALGVEAWAAALPGMAAELAAATARTAPELAAAVTRARAALATADPDRVVVQSSGSHTLLDALRFRLVEAVVHGLDVGVDPDPVAQRLVVKALVEVLTIRAPGHAVELRIPPYTAVQVLEGARHTRGTPPHTIEVQPRAWLDLATGRMTWADAVATGAARVRGERADLSALLPLLR